MQNLADFEFEWRYVSPQIWAQVELHYSLMAATIPSLHIVLKNLTTGWLADLKDRSETLMAAKTLGKRYGRSSVMNSNMMTLGSSGEQATIVELQHWTDQNVKTKAFARREVHRDDDASDGSGRHILVHRTLDVDHGRS